LANKRLLRSQNKKSKPRWFHVIGLSCCCVRGVNPYFFLFSDIDTKEKEYLRMCLKFFAKNELSCYYYHTAKGYHVISPCLLNIEQWSDMKLALGKIMRNYYEFLVLRWSNKKIKDNKLNWIDNGTKFKESITLHQAIAKRFRHTTLNCGVKTNLQFVKYREYTLG